MIFTRVGINRAGTVALGIGLMLASIVAMLFAPLVALARGPAVAKFDSVIRAEVPRYRLPSWLSWFQTPDEPMPGGLYEAQIERAYDTRGRWWAATLWLWRNSLYGLAWKFARPADGYLDPLPGIAERGDLWRWQGRLGPLKIGTGWKVHRADFEASAFSGPWVAVPFFTIRKAKQD